MGLHSRDLKIKHISCCSRRLLATRCSRLIVEEIVCCSRPASTSPPPPGRRAGRGAAAAPYRVSALLTHTHHLVPPSSPPSGARRPTRLMQKLTRRAKPKASTIFALFCSEVRTSRTHRIPPKSKSNHQNGQKNQRIKYHFHPTYPIPLQNGIKTIKIPGRSR